MTPAQRTAREAWNALPDAIRAEAIALAQRGQAHPDTAVAAVIVARIRGDRAQRRRILQPLYAPSVGIYLATTAVAALTGRFAFGLAAMPAIFLVALAEKPIFLPRFVISDSVPVTGEAPSIRALIRATPATEPQPLEIRRRTNAPKDIAVAVVTAVTITALLLAIVPPAPGQDLALVGMLALAVLVTLLPLLLFQPRVLRKAGLVKQPIRLDDGGLCFGNDPPSLGQTSKAPSSHRS